jgi:hypothetical protein
VQYIAPCSVGGAKRQPLGLGNEGRGGIVDQDVERSIAPDRIHHGVHCGAMANVAGQRCDLAAEIAAHLCSGRLQQFEPAAADAEICAKLGKASCHRRPQPGAAAGDQDAFCLEQVLFEHGLSSSPRTTDLILRSRAVARRLEGWPRIPVLPSFETRRRRRSSG